MQPDIEFAAHLKSGRLCMQRSRLTGQFIFYPRVAVPGSGDQDLEWAEIGGNGTVYAVTVVHPKPPAEAYNVVLVDLDEGTRMMSRVENVDRDALKIGLRVKARICNADTQPIVVFDPA